MGAIVRELHQTLLDPTTAAATATATVSASGSSEELKQGDARGKPPPSCFITSLHERWSNGNHTVCASTNRQLLQQSLVTRTQLVLAGGLT